MNENKPVHKLKLVHTYSTGAQKWECPICGYQIIVKNQNSNHPDYILNYGDKRVEHVWAGASDITWLVNEAMKDIVW